jgi:hypothetical protein
MGSADAAPGATEGFLRSLPFIGDSRMVEGVASAASSPERQVSRQAQRDMVEALIWLDTGASANEGQVNRLMDAYMPSYTDSEKAKQYKMDRILGILETGKIRSGRAWTQQAEDAANYLRQTLPKLFGAVPGRGEVAGGQPTVAGQPRPGEIRKVPY